MKKSALITGLTGQLGSYLAEYLLANDYDVHGLMRRNSAPNTWRIDSIKHRIHLHEGDLADSGSLVRVLQAVEPCELYSLGAQSFVPTSFTAPVHTCDITGLGPIRLLEAIHQHHPFIKLYQASSSEMFGASPPPQAEMTPFMPRSPYGAAKILAFHNLQIYRDAYGIFACNGIHFNMESERRGETFVTRKITTAAARIKLRLQDKLFLGNLDAKRDWSHASDHARAMHAMLQQEKGDDYVVASGETHTIREFLEVAFARVDIDWQKHVEIDPKFYRPAEVHALCGDYSKAKRVLGWEPTISFTQLIHMMVDADLTYEKSKLK